MFKNYILTPDGFLIYDGIGFHVTPKITGATHFDAQEESIKAAILYCSLTKQDIRSIHFISAHTLMDIPSNTLLRSMKNVSAK